MRTLRLLLFDDCDRDCPECCNRDWDLDALPVVDSYSGYDQVVITGGEPLLKPGVIVETIERIRAENRTASVYIYTARTRGIPYALALADGITLTLHEQSDVGPFKDLCQDLTIADVSGKSMRLNVFEGVVLSRGEVPDCFDVRFGYRWIKNCPLPKHEEFKRL